MQSSFISTMLATSLSVTTWAWSAERQAPLMRDFIGINGHTVQFKPELYKPVCSQVRDYHPVNWDLGEDSSSKPPFPFAQNKVDWSRVYGSWKKENYHINASLMFESMKHEHWKNIPEDAYAYGLAFAKHFGPSSTGLVDAAEIGNEPGKWSDADYRILFENMAKGLRAGDTKLKIVTCAADADKSGDYMKAMSCVKGFEKLYDVINIHSYAQTENWPTWRRSFPEDPKLLDYTTRIERLIAYRDEHAPDKPIWITEFGYDASTKPAPKEGTFKKWVDVTDAQQAQWLTRSFLIFARLAVDKAYIYFFNDKDEPSFHASSGITRNFQPKPAYHAIAHLQQSLGNYRYHKTITNTAGALQVDEYSHDTDKKNKVWVAWLASGTNVSKKVSLAQVPGKVTKAEVMPLSKDDAAKKITFTATKDQVEITIGESPVYLWISTP